uniref:GED domain-containing protein n=1 Tax=viral metagenome TaxID=1070528 RepID=A0A6M3XVM5_9ZZZZ
MTDYEEKIKQQLVDLLGEQEKTTEQRDALNAQLSLLKGAIAATRMLLVEKTEEPIKEEK